MHELLPKLETVNFFANDGSSVQIINVNKTSSMSNLAVVDLQLKQ